MSDDEMREFARSLFGRDAEIVPDGSTPDPAKGNHVPREGSNPTTKPNDMQTFTAALFERGLAD